MFAIKPRRRRHRTRLVVTASLVLAVALFGWWNHVPGNVSGEDVRFIGLILSENGHEGLLRAEAASFADEISIISAVQDAVLAHAPENVGLSMDAPREPEYLYRARKGLRYDRSRVIEKTLTHMGFETRHVAIYSTAKTGSAMESLLTPGNPSHAVSEVRTRKGWLVIDSNGRWLALTEGGTPMSTRELLAAATGRGDERAWTQRNRSPMNPIFSEPYTYVIGLYSRHGRFYPPYTPMPDVNIGQLLQNFI